MVCELAHSSKMQYLNNLKELSTAFLKVDSVYG